MDFSFCRDPELVKKIGAATALEVRATGVPYAFAPCIAVDNNISKRLFKKLDSDVFGTV